MTVGGFGRALVLGARLMPRVTDRLVEAIGFFAQHGETSPDPACADNLFENCEDGTIEDSRNAPIRRTSLWLKAQKHPRRATAAISAAVGAVAPVADAIAPACASFRSRRCR